MVTLAFRALARARGLTTPVFQDFHDIFGDFFWLQEDLFWRWAARGVDAAAAQRGGPICAMTCHITFEEASAGCGPTKIKLPRQEYCESCNGTGREKRVPAFKACQSCGGPRPACLSTRILHHSTRTCPACQGAGQIVERGVAPIAAGKAVWSAEKDHRVAYSPGRGHRYAAACRRRRRARGPMAVPLAICT